MTPENGKQKPLKIFLVAGEPSGDVLGARLMQGLKEEFSNREIEFYGVCGPLMQAQGMNSLFAMDELTVMGVAEVVPQIPNLLRRIKQTAEFAIQVQPDAFITIDAPDFSFRVAKKLTDQKFSKIHYVAPSVWAWRAGRAQKLASLYDRVLTLLPFELKFFEDAGMKADFVGHSIIESGAGEGSSDRFIENYNCDPNKPLVMVLPGSRRSEVSRHLDIFKQTLERLSESLPKLQIVIPVVGKSAVIVKEATVSWPFKTILVTDQQDKYDAMAASDVALAASGTVGLELALAKLPSVIAYKMHPITAFLAKRLIKLDYVNLVNILQDEQVVPELLLENCVPEKLAPALLDLLQSEDAREKQISGYAKAAAQLSCSDIAPGRAAAQAVRREIESVSN
ncbi:lipid-A-disaccharide synthase [Sneathiella glossodoripedis]|uniref:lipid-A-disaccharide synthase n=1 Tax=Sneathiella glossodoripedis TaxID=418853 RepID=UPI00046E7DB8|nr:lipid-A-disaccharide synthase [Sneathiella glossodoripedis]